MPNLAKMCGTVGEKARMGWVRVVLANFKPHYKADNTLSVFMS